MIDDQLAAPGKEIPEGDLPAFALEGVVLVDQLPRQLAPLARKLAFVIST